MSTTTCLACEAVHSPGPYYEAERGDETAINRICRACHRNWPCAFARQKAVAPVTEPERERP